MLKFFCISDPKDKGGRGGPSIIIPARVSSPFPVGRSFRYRHRHRHVNGHTKVILVVRSTGVAACPHPLTALAIQLQTQLRPANLVAATLVSETVRSPQSTSVGLARVRRDCSPCPGEVTVAVGKHSTASSVNPSYSAPY